MSKQIAILAIDIETNGPQMMKNEIISIGYCLGDTEGNILRKRRINFHFTSEFERSCRVFWNKQSNILLELQRDQLENSLAIQTFIDDVDNFDGLYDLRIISDNPSYDLSFLNFYMSKYLDRLPINYIHNNGDSYRCIFCTDSYSRGVLGSDYTNPWTYDSDIIGKHKLLIDSKHSHYPDDDAEYIYQLHTALIKKLQTDHNN